MLQQKLKPSSVKWGPKKGSNKKQKYQEGELKSAISVNVQG